MTEETNTPKTEVNRSSNLGIKDLLIPISIIVAGLSVGAGLYFGGSPSSGGLDKQPGTGAQNTKTLLDFVKEAGVKESDFEKCFESGEKKAVVQRHVDDAVETGGAGTPWSVLIGPSGKKYPINGALPLASIEQAIELAKSEASMGPGGTESELALENIDPVTDADHIKGNPNADIVIIEYSDFDCPFCARFHESMNSIIQKHGNEVVWVYRHFPLEQLHPNAPAVALASECVAELGGNEAFWKFADGYLSNK